MRRTLAATFSILVSLPIVALAQESIAGTYAGEYVSKSGKSGGYQLTFTPGPNGNWTGEVVAVLEGVGKPTRSPMTSRSTRARSSTLAPGRRA
jgi:hypothetical protein